MPAENFITSFCNVDRYLFMVLTDSIEKTVSLNATNMMTKSSYNIDVKQLFGITSAEVFCMFDFAIVKGSS